MGQIESRGPCCNGYGAKVAEQSLLADGPSTPRKPTNQHTPGKLAGQPQQQQSVEVGREGRQESPTSAQKGRLEVGLERLQGSPQEPQEVLSTRTMLVGQERTQSPVANAMSMMFVGQERRQASPQEPVRQSIVEVGVEGAQVSSRASSQGDPPVKSAAPSPDVVVGVHGAQCGDTGGSDDGVMLSPGVGDKTRQHPSPGPQDGSLEFGAEAVSPPPPLPPPLTSESGQELSGLAWAKAQGCEKGKSFEEWAEMAKELNGVAFRNRDAPQGETMKVFKSEPVMEDERGEEEAEAEAKKAHPRSNSSLERGLSKIPEVEKSRADKSGKSGCGCFGGQRTGGSLSKKGRAKAEALFQGLLSNGKLQRVTAEAELRKSFGTYLNIFEDGKSGTVSLPEYLDMCDRVKQVGFSEKEVLEGLEGWQMRRLEECRILDGMK